MTSQEIVDRYGVENCANMDRLFPDPDLVLRNTHFIPQEDETFNRDSIIHWWMHVYVPDGFGDYRVLYEAYKTWSNALYRYFRYARPNGYVSQTNQSSIKIGCYKKTPLEPQLAELQLWVPHVKEVTFDKDEERSYAKAKPIRIFESSLSLSGSWTLYVTDTGYCEIYRNQYVEQKFNTLAEAVDHIRLNLWYQKKEDGQ